MNKIIREHYPASKLPEDLREGIDETGWVTVTITEEQRSPSREKLAQYIEQARERAKSVNGVTTEEAVKRVRDLRDEWDA